MVATIWTWGGWTALTAVGTVGAVVVALYLGPFRERRSRPLLEMRPGVVQVLNRDTRAPGSASLAIATLRVSNRPGRNTASAVEVVVQAVSVDDQVVPLLIAPLMWSQSRTSQIDIGPGGTFDVDLLRITRMGDEGKRRAAIGYAGPNQDAGFFLPPQAELDQLPGGRYDFTLSVRGWNLGASVWTVRARFDGVWGNHVDDVHQHLIVEPPIRPR
ncbi:MAG: hypothetical protein ACP5H2_11355 [Solirubrobacteraceae bacterium]